MFSIPFHRGGIAGSPLTQGNISHINASSRSKTRSTYLFVKHSLIKAANQSCLKKDPSEFRKYIKNNPYINTQYQTNKDAKNDFLKKRFFKKPATNTGMYSWHFQQLKKNRFNHKCLETSPFLLSQMKLNYVVFSTVFNSERTIMECHTPKGGTGLVPSVLSSSPCWKNLHIMAAKKLSCRLPLLK